VLYRPFKPTPGGCRRALSIFATLLALPPALAALSAKGAEAAIPLPAPCTLENPTWEDAKACLNDLTTQAPDRFPAGVIGYQRDGDQHQPHVYASSVGGVSADSLFPIGSMTKPMVTTALAKLVYDNYTDKCASNANAPDCYFPQAFGTTLYLALDRIDSQTRAAWYRSDYIGNPNKRLEQIDWKTRKLRISHLMSMSSGLPNHKVMDACISIGSWTCGTGAADVAPCASDFDVYASPCDYVRLYQQYLDSGRFAPLPNECKPLPIDDQGVPHPRTFAFDDPPQVRDPNGDDALYERRWIGEPGLHDECIYDGTKWIGGRQATTLEVARFAMGVPLLFKPGTRFEYSNFNTVLAAYLIQRVSGLPYNVYLKEQLFSRLGMTNTFVVANRKAAPFAVGQPAHAEVHHPSAPPWDHSRDEGGNATTAARIVDLIRVPANPARAIVTLAPPLQTDAGDRDQSWDEDRSGWSFTWPEGGVYSTAGDLLKFLAFFRTGQASDGQEILPGSPDDPATFLGFVQQPSRYSYCPDPDYPPDPQGGNWCDISPGGPCVMVDGNQCQARMNEGFGTTKRTPGFFSVQGEDPKDPTDELTLDERGRDPTIGAFEGSFGMAGRFMTTFWRDPRGRIDIVVLTPRAIEQGLKDYPPEFDLEDSLESLFDLGRVLGELRCEPTLELQSLMLPYPQSGPRFIRKAGTIRAGRLSVSSFGFTVGAGSQVTLLAQQRVLLEPGVRIGGAPFTAGDRFRAAIEPSICTAP
jgi:CubicO group peptidase (beta-lactamase class C family)